MPKKAGNPHASSLKNPSLYSDDEIEYMTAIELYKKKFGRRFLTIAEHHHVLIELGYAKIRPAKTLTRREY